MGRSGKIKWTKSDASAVSALVRRFNAKITRVSRKTPSIAIIQPKYVNAAEMKQRMQELTRADFKRELRVMERYLRKGAEMPYTTRAGKNITVWEKREIDNAFRSINARNAALMRKLNPSEEKGTITTYIYPRKNTVQEIEPKHWDRFASGLHQAALETTQLKKIALYKENYLTALDEVFGSHSRIYQTMKDVDAEKLVELYYTNPILQLTFIYSLEDADRKEKLMLDELERIRNIEGW